MEHCHSVFLSHITLMKFNSTPSTKTTKKLHHIAWRWRRSLCIYLYWLRRVELSTCKWLAANTRHQAADRSFWKQMIDANDWLPDPTNHCPVPVPIIKSFRGKYKRPRCIYLSHSNGSQMTSAFPTSYCLSTCHHCHFPWLHILRILPSEVSCHISHRRFTHSTNFINVVDSSDFFSKWRLW